MGESNIYHRKGFSEMTISDVVFSNDEKVTFLNNGIDCQLPLSQFNEEYELLV